MAVPVQDDHDLGLHNIPTAENTNANSFAQATHHMSYEEKQAAIHAAKFGYGPLAHMVSSQAESMLPAFVNEYQPCVYKPIQDKNERKFGNPSPVGLCGFALTTFLLSLINLGTLNLKSSAIVLSVAFAYGGLVQLLAGMWELAVGNTIGATAFSSYGGFWISYAIILTPGGFKIEATTEAIDGPGGLDNLLGLYLMGWFIFTTVLWICTLKSSVAFCGLIFFVDLTFLLLGIAYLCHDSAGPQIGCLRAGGAAGIIASFAAWYNALAGMADSSNTFFPVPVADFPWSEQRRAARVKADHHTA